MVAGRRDAFNGALLWKLPLNGYGQPLFEDVSGQPVPDYILRTPLSLNRRLVVQGDKLYAALNYREGPLSVLDAATGKTLHAIDLGGIVDEIVAAGDTVVCRVRSEIPMPDPKLKRDYRMRLQKELEAAGVEDPKAEANVVRPIEILLRQPLERIVAVDAASGRIRWRFDAPLVATQSLAMKDGQVVFHNYQAIICLDAATGQVRWTFENPATERRRFGAATCSATSCSPTTGCSGRVPRAGAGSACRWPTAGNSGGTRAWAPAADSGSPRHSA